MHCCPTRSSFLAVGLSVDAMFWHFLPTWDIARWAGSDNSYQHLEEPAQRAIANYSIQLHASSAHRFRVYGAEVGSVACK
jgi:hypothetical protein